MAPLKADWTNADLAADQHPQAHNDAAAALNNLTVQRGSENITAWASASSKSVTVTFSVAFSVVPRVFVNIRETASVLPRTWTLRATGVSTTAFTINMFTVDTSSSAPTGDVKVDWLAIAA